jgi:ABC-2 type transport system ATP-binding protein
MSAAAPIAELHHVTKAFDKEPVVDDLSLTVPAGQVFGLIGPSGCGKTTVIRLLVGILAPTEGKVSVLGSEPSRLSPAQRARLGYASQAFELYPTLTVTENARFVAGLYGVGFFRLRRRLRPVLEFLELWEARRRLARDLSGGMQRRLALGCALIHEPRVIFVDEPTAGLDPMLREKIWDYLRELRDRGTTVFVTTQHLDEARYCDTVAIMGEGRLLALGPPDELRQRAMGGDIVELEIGEASRDDLAALRHVPGVRSMRWTEQEKLRLVVDQASTATPAILQELQQRGIDVVSVDPYEASFDEVFMKVVGDHA